MKYLLVVVAAILYAARVHAQDTDVNEDVTRTFNLAKAASTELTT
jgi:hypothetical protein